MRRHPTRRRAPLVRSLTCIIMDIIKIKTFSTTLSTSFFMYARQALGLVKLDGECLVVDSAEPLNPDPDPKPEAESLFSSVSLI